MVLNLNQRIFIIETYYLNNKSYNKVRELFEDKFNQIPPSNVSIFKIVNKFHNTGSILNKKKKRKRHVLTPAKLSEINSSFDENPRLSLRSRSQENQVSQSTCRRAAKLLGYKPYRIQVVHELKTIDYEKRMKYCQWFIENVKAAEDLGNF